MNHALHRNLCLIILGLFLGGCQSMGGSGGSSGGVDGVYSVRSFGATGDGVTPDTSAVNAAIAKASSGGGGIVQFPAGTYLCYSIHLQSNITLYLDHGATILAAGDSDEHHFYGEYDLPEPMPNGWDKYQDFGHCHWHNSLIWGEDLHDVAILGPGLINGRGLSHGRNVHPERQKIPYGENQDNAVDSTTRPVEQPLPNDKDRLPDGVGNKALALKNCHNVTLRDFSILHGGHFAILATAVDNFTMDNVTLDTDRDGVDIDCCRNVRVSNCSINSPWDDGLCLKSSFGLGYNRSTENVTITNCFVTGGYQLGTVIDGTFQRIGLDYSPDRRAARTGRIKFGTESNGGFKNISISNCVVDYCGGIALESVDGAILEDVTISNITMRDVVNAPIFIRLGARLRGPDAKVGVVRRINIDNIVSVNSAARFAAEIMGIPGHPVEDVHLSNIQLLVPGGGTLIHAATRPEEMIKEYPEPGRFRGMPSFGFFIRHVTGIELTNVDIKWETEDQRPAFVLEDVKDADFQHVKAPHATSRPTFVLHGVDDLTIHQFKGLGDRTLDHVDQDEF